MARMVVMVDVLGRRATRHDNEVDVGKPMMLPVAVALHSSPRKEGGERTI